MSDDGDVGGSSDDGDGGGTTDDRNVGGNSAGGDGDRETAILHAVTGAAGLSIGGVLTQRGLVFATNLLLTHALGVGAYGLYALGRRIVGMLHRFAHLGSNPTLVRFLPKYTDDGAQQDRVLGTAYLTTGVTSLVLVLGLLVFAPTINLWMGEGPEFVVVLRTFALLLPALVFVWQLGNVFRSLERVEYQILIVRFLRPGAQLVAVIVAFLAGLSVVGTVRTILVGLSAVLVAAAVLSLRELSIRPSLPRSRSELREFYNYAIPNSLGSFGALLRSRVDVLLVGVLLTADAAGIYNVALFLAALVALPLLSVNQLFPPVASRLYSDGDVETLQATYSTATRWIVTAALLLGVFEMAFRDPLLGLFGAAYRRGEIVLVAFAIGQLANASVGSAGWLLLMTDHQYVVALNNWLLGLLNIGLSYLLLLEFGLVGAALGTAGSLVLINVLRVATLWYFEGLHPYDRAFLKPLAAAAVTAVVATALRPLLDGIALLVVGAVVTTAVFAATLVALGPEPEDRGLARAARGALPSG
jgi:O-antigen/teichoic acid export membrane protein